MERVISGSSEREAPDGARRTRHGPAPVIGHGDADVVASLNPGDISQVQRLALAAQRTAGNQAVGRLLGTLRPAGSRRAVPVQRDPPPATAAPAPAGTAAVTTAMHEGVPVTADDLANRAAVEGQVATKGWATTDAWSTRFINMEPIDELRFGAFGQHVEPAALRTMRDSLHRVTDAVGTERLAFIKDFEARSTTTANDVLDAAEKQITAQLSDLGITANTFLGFRTGGYSMDAGKASGLQSAARALASVKRTADAAAREYLAVKAEADTITRATSAPSLAEALPDVFLPPDLKNRLDAARDHGLGLAHDYDGQAAERAKAYPILAAFTQGMDAAGRLDELAGGDSGSTATQVGKIAHEKLENIATVRGEIGARFSVWKEPHLRQLNKTAMSTKPWQDRVVEDKVASVAATEADTQMLVAAVALGLGLVAAIPTAGASIGVAALVTAAAVGGMAVSIYGAYERAEDVAVASAAQNAALDRAQSISQGEPPDLFWLALDVATAIVDLGAATSALKTLTGLIGEARAAGSADKLAELLTATRNAGLPDVTQSKIIAAAIGGSGGDAKITKSLEQLSYVFRRSATSGVGDTQLSQAFEQAANKAIAQNKVALFRGTTAERRASVVAQLRRQGRGESEIVGLTDAVMTSVEKKLVSGCYDPVTDTIYLRADRSPSSVAATLAHELTHQRQELVVGLGRLNTLESEFQAFYAQKQFLISLDLPPERVPEAYRFLINADNEAIRAHVVEKYAVDPTIRQFSGLEEAGDWILKQLKGVSR